MTHLTCTSLLDLGRMTDPTLGPGYPDPAPGIICGGVHGIGGSGPVMLEMVFAIPVGP